MQEQQFIIISELGNRPEEMEIKDRLYIANKHEDLGRIDGDDEERSSRMHQQPREQSTIYIYIYIAVIIIK
jgi:hypothetical protein